MFSFTYLHRKTVSKFNKDEQLTFNSSALGKTCQSTFERMGKSSVIFDAHPRSIAVGDFNNDHQVDVVVANAGTNTIWILLLYINESVAVIKTYSTGSQSIPYSVVVDDFNNDNCLDFAVANYGANNIGVFLGYCNGIFANPYILSTGSSRPLFITTGDFNNDNRLDMVIVNYGTNTIGLLLGYGNGSFQDQKTYFTGYDSIPYSLAVGDFNKDNQLDIAITNYGINNIHILLGDGNGSFANQQTYTTSRNSNPASIAIGDFNNDDYLDIVVANYGTRNIGIFLNYGNGTFAPQTTYSIGSNSGLQHVTVGDFNKDNALDIVIVDSNNDRIYIFLGNGNGTFTIISTLDEIAGYRPVFAAVADFNKNNQPGLVVANYDGNKLFLAEGYSIKPSARQTNYFLRLASHPSTVAVSDFNNNNHLDIVVNGYEGSSVRILMDYDNGTFTRETSFSTGNESNPQEICVSDLNNDSHTDIVTANMDSDNVGVLLGQGNGTFATVTTYSAGIGSRPYSVAVGDVNNDNQLDIISANTGSSSIGVFLGHGNGTFATVTTYSVGIGSHPYSVAIGDVNNDNQLDIVVTITNPDSVIIFLNYIKGAFAIIAVYSTGYGSAPFSVALADFNSDNHLDIVVANSHTDNVGVQLGYGNGTFGRQTTYATGFESLPYSVIVADFNHDNRWDIAATNLRSDNVVIFYGYGNGSFELARTYFTGFGSHPYGIVAADFNNDKQLEIVVTLWGTGNVAILAEYYAAEFAMKVMWPIGFAPQPYSIAISDFNNDNRSDIVVANSGTDSIGILLGLGNGTFGTPMIYPIGIGSHPQYVITADINNDNQYDIVTANSDNDSISVILGYGNGSFKAQMLYPTSIGSHPYAITFGDLNNDNRLDLVVATEGTDEIGIFLGYDYASFQSQKTYTGMGNLGSRAVVVNDFNNDNYPDIAVAFYTTNNIGVLLGYGNGNFSVMMTFSTGVGSAPYSLTVADINKDGRLDIVVANSGTDNIGILLGYGNGSFASTMTSSNGYGSKPCYVAVADFNDDDRLDIVVINVATNNIGIIYGYGNGSFAAMVIYLTRDGYYLNAVTVGDFNNDGKVDIAVINYNVDNVGIFLGYGNGSFANQVTYSTGRGTRPCWVAFGDFNNDQQLDMTTANYNDNSISILLGYGNGSFATFNGYFTGSGSMPMYLSVNDFNNDHKLDIAVVNYGTNTIVILFGFGDGTFLLGSAFSTGIGSQPNTLAVGDFNKDGRLDIAVGNPASNNVGVFLGNGTKPFSGTRGRSTGAGSQPHSVAIGDFNNDGRSDVVVANYGTDNVGILLGQGHSMFDTMITYFTGVGSAPYFVAIGDFNNDNQSDIVVTNSGTDNIAILLGYGNGTFNITASHSTGVRSRPYTVAIADFNNDNISDVVVANSGTNNVLLLYGFGDGTFGNEESYPLGYGYQPYSVAAKDLNQDGWIDIVIACYGTDNVEILMKVC
jgi:hypothetical protein